MFSAIKNGPYITFRSYNKALLAPRAGRLAGAIAGRALYDGRLDPQAALALIRSARAAA